MKRGKISFSSKFYLILVLFVLFLMMVGVYAQVPDADQDGVPNADDKCPNSLTGNVDTVGCSCEQKTFYSYREVTEQGSFIEETCASRYPNANQAGRASGTGCCNIAPNTYCQVQSGRAVCVSSAPQDYGSVGGAFDFSFTRPGPSDNNFQWRIGETQLISWNGPTGMIPAGVEEESRRISYTVSLLNYQCGDEGCGLYPVMQIDSTEGTSINWVVGRSCNNIAGEYRGGGEGPDYIPPRRECSNVNLQPGQYWIRIQPYGFSDRYMTTANPINIVAGGTSNLPHVDGLTTIPHPSTVGQSVTVRFLNPQNAHHCAFRYFLCSNNPEESNLCPITASTQWLHAIIRPDCNDFQLTPVGQSGLYIVQVGGCREDGTCPEPYSSVPIRVRPATVTPATPAGSRGFVGCSVNIPTPPSATVKAPPNPQIPNNLPLVNLTWPIVPGAVSYNVRLEDLSGRPEKYWDGRFTRCPPNADNEIPHYYCVNGVTATSDGVIVAPTNISIPDVAVYRDRNYLFWVQAVFSPCTDYVEGRTTFNVPSFGVSSTAPTPPPTGTAPQCPINPNNINPPTVTLRSNSQVTLSWANVPGASSYHIRLNDNTNNLNNAAPANHFNAVSGPPENNCLQHYVCENNVPSATTSVSNVPVTAGSSYSFWVDSAVSGCAPNALNKIITFTVPSTPSSISGECPLCESRIAYSSSQTRYTICQGYSTSGINIPPTELDFGSGVKLIAGASSDIMGSDGGTQSRVALRLYRESPYTIIAENTYGTGAQITSENTQVRVVSIENIGSGNCLRRKVVLEITPTTPPPAPQDTTPPEIIQAGVTQGGQSIQSDGTVDPSQPFTAIVRARDSSGISSIKIYVDNYPLTCTPSVTLPTTSGDVVTCTIEQSSPLPAAMLGTHVLHFEAADNSPNKNKFTSLPFYINFMNPYGQMPPNRVALSLDKPAYYSGEKIRVTVVSTNPLASVILKRKKNGVPQDDINYGNIGSCQRGAPCTFEVGPEISTRRDGQPDQWEAWITVTDSYQPTPVDSNHIFYTVTFTTSSNPILKINGQQSGVVQLSTGQTVNVEISNAPADYRAYFSALQTQGGTARPLDKQPVGSITSQGILQFSLGPITSSIVPPGRYIAFVELATPSQPSVRASITNSVEINVI